MKQPDDIYHSFLIRLWVEDRHDNREEEWRIELESIQSGQKHQFPDLEAMLDFFRDQIKMTQMEQTKDISHEGEE